MFYITEDIVNKLINSIKSIDEVQSAGISGGKSVFPKQGEGDIDIFIYCDTIPEIEKRQAMLCMMGDFINDTKTKVFEGGHWGSGDFCTINGVETWLMYFTVDETLKDVEAILNGEYPEKLDNYYYPIGRCAMLSNINIIYDKNSFLDSLKKRLSLYPEELRKTLTEYHMKELDDVEDLERAAARKDLLFYHFAIDIAVDHYLQALFAMNRTYFPSRKRTLKYIENFRIKPDRCSEKLLEVIKFGSDTESIPQSYQLWINMIRELKQIKNSIG